MARDDAENEARLTAIVANDPEIQELQARLARHDFGGLHPARGGIVRLQNAMSDRLAHLGIDPGQYRLVLSDEGPAIKKKSWLDRNASNLVMLGAIGLTGGLALSAAPFIGAGAAAGTGTAAAGTGAAAGTTGAVAGTTGATAATTAATVAPAAGGIIGAVQKASPYLEAGGRVAGAVSAARAANRGVEAEYGQQQDRAAAVRQGLLNDQIGMDLDQRRYADDHNQQQIRNALFGDFLTGVNDVSIASPDGVPRSNITGGLRPSAMANRGTVGREVYQRSIANVLDPLQPGGIADANGQAPAGTGRRLPSLPSVPELRELPETTGTDRALDLINIGTAGIGVLDDIWSNRQAPAPAPVPGALPNTPTPFRRLRPGEVSFRS
jgi:hypothetical protein